MRTALLHLAFCVLLAVTLVGCARPPARPDDLASGDYSYAIEHLSWRAERLMDELELPGLAVVVFDDEQVIWEGYYGVVEVESDESVSDETVWRMGSITKVLTAIEVMALVEDGLVELDSPVDTYLPAFQPRSWEDDPVPITVRHLLTHRSGIPRNCGLPTWYFDPGEALLQAQVEELSLFYAAHRPDTRYHYSNAGFNVLAALVEERRQTPWPSRLDAHLFGPVGMTHSALLWDWLPEDASVATGHTWEDGENVALPQGDLISFGSGSLLASAIDVAALGQVVLRGGGPLLSTQTTEQMLEVQRTRPRDPKKMALGWIAAPTQLDEPMVFHDGTNAGTESILALLPESGLGVVAVANSTAFADAHGALAVEALELLLEAKTGGAPDIDEAPSSCHLHDADLDRFVGTYVCDDDPVEVVRRGDHLKATMDGVGFRLEPLGPTRFDVRHWMGDPGDLGVRFLVGAPDEQDLMIVSIEQMDRVICPRYPEVEEVPPLWHALTGRYRVVPRVSSAYSDDWEWPMNVVVEEPQRLRVGRFLVWPRDPSALRIVGGQWDGETILRDPQTGEMVFQHERMLPLIPW